MTFLDGMMGFEQLASLRQQLTQPAQTAQPVVVAHRPSRPVAAKPARKAVDPVILTIGALQKHFPKVFPKSPLPKIPLKLKIHLDLQAQVPHLGLSEAALRDAIKTWCRGKRYWACLVAGAARVDLTGTAVGHVSPGEATWARIKEAQRYGDRPRPNTSVQPTVTAEAGPTIPPIDESSPEA